MDDRIAQLGSILGVWAHPDDEVFSSAGLMEMALANGQSVACVTATHGEQGVYNPSKWPANTISATRTSELDKVYQILGVKYHYWLGYEDGKCKDVGDDEAASQLVPLIEKLSIDTIITFPPNGVTGHEDHIALHNWAVLASKRSARPLKVLFTVTRSDLYQKYQEQMDKRLNIFFNLDKPDLYDEEECDVALSLSEEVVDKKYQAIKSMPSQTETMFKEFSEQFLRGAFSSECFVFAGNEHKS